MKIKIKLFATLRDGRDKVLDKEYGDDSRIREVLTDLAIEDKDVAILLQNGRDAAPENPMQDGDTISIFPPVGGG